MHLRMQLRPHLHLRFEARPHLTTLALVQLCLHFLHAHVRFPLRAVPVLVLALALGTAPKLSNLQLYAVPVLVLVLALVVAPMPDLELALVEVVSVLITIA